jgi:hypothetical protein
MLCAIFIGTGRLGRQSPTSTQGVIPFARYEYTWGRRLSSFLFRSSIIIVLYLESIFSLKHQRQ